MAKVITASSAGTAFEWYDFFIFGSLAQTISKVFFTGLDPTAALIAALGLFAAGFAFRPLGAILFGVMGDRIGRKATFLVTVSLMGGATFAIGLLPTYGQAGILAPILLIFLRICQGTALGGEYGGAAIYVAEHAPDDRRGTMTGWIQSSAAFGLLAALLVILATRTALGEDQFLAWGWRIPFLASIILLAVSVWLRTRLAESPAFAKLQDGGRRLPHAASRSLRRAAEPEARRHRLFRHHVRPRSGLVLHILLHAGLSRTVPGRAGSGGEFAGDCHDAGQRATLRVFRVAQRSLRTQAGDAQRDAAGIGPVFPGLPDDRRGRQSGARQRPADHARCRHYRPRDLHHAIRSGGHAALRHGLRRCQELARRARHFPPHCSFRRWFDDCLGRHPAPARFERRTAVDG